MGIWQHCNANSLGMPGLWLSLVAILCIRRYRKVINLLIHHISHSFVGQRRKMGRCRAPCCYCLTTKNPELRIRVHTHTHTPHTRGDPSSTSAGPVQSHHMQQRSTRHLKQHEVLYNAITSENLPKWKRACSTSELSPTSCSHVAPEFNTRPGGPRANRGREREREGKRRRR